MSRFAAFLICVLALAGGCSAKKALNEPQVQLVNARAFVQKAFPGVSGDTWYFLNYRVEFDIKTNSPVHFTKILADEQEITVQTVMLGNQLLNPSQGNYITNDTSDVRVHAVFPVLHSKYKDQTNDGAPGIPEKLTLYFKAGGKTFSREIIDITAEPNEYRPGVGRPEE